MTVRSIICEVVSLVTLAAFFAAGCGPSTQTAPSEDAVAPANGEETFAALTLDEAIKGGKVEVEITGIGGSTGDTIQMAVQRKVPETLRLTLTPGTVFKSTTGNVQNMMATSIKGERLGETSYRPTTNMVLTDNDKHTYIVEAYCMDFHKGNPGPSDSFTLASPNDRGMKIVEVGKKKSASIQAIQAALWMDRENVSATELKSRFPVNDGDIAVARGLLAAVGDSSAPDSGSETRVHEPSATAIPAGSIMLMKTPFGKPERVAPEGGKAFVLVCLQDVHSDLMRPSAFHLEEAGGRQCILRAVGTGMAGNYRKLIESGSFVFQQVAEQMAVGESIVVVFAYEIPKNYETPLTLRFQSRSIPLQLSAEPPQTTPTKGEYGEVSLGGTDGSSSKRIWELVISKGKVRTSFQRRSTEDGPKHIVELETPIGVKEITSVFGKPNEVTNVEATLSSIRRLQPKSSPLWHYGSVQLTIENDAVTEIRGDFDIP